jgi:hypothetical protein
MGWTAGVRCPTEARDFSVFHSVKTGFVAHSISYPMGTGAFTPAVKRPGHETDHSPPHSAEVKNGRAVPAFPRMSPGVVIN